MAKGKYLNCIEMGALLLALGLIGCGANNASGTVVERSVTVDATAEEVTQETSKKREEQEVSIESEDGLTGQNTQEDSETSKTEPETKPESETSEAPTEVIDNLYGFGPVSYDLSALPAMENKLYAEWEGNIYFRQYSDEDLEEGALWANFGDIPNTEKELMCLTPDGELTQVGRTTDVAQCIS